jgi:hypothetical protein
MAMRCRPLDPAHDAGKSTGLWVGALSIISGR